MNLDKKIDKSEFMVFLKRRNIFHGFELVDNLDFPKAQFNPSVPNMLIRSISQFVRKDMKEIVIEDAVKLYKAVSESISSLDYRETAKFRNKNGLTFFGCSQYKLLDYYLRSVDVS
jgi:hypothetical protein